MKVRLGYIGVEDTMKLVLSVIRKFNEVECYSFLHTRFEEIPALLDTHSRDVDVWLLSGPLPLATALSHVQSSRREDWPPMYAIPFSEQSLYRALCQICYTKGLKADELSFDVYGQEELLPVFAELGVDASKLQCMPYGGSYQQLIEFHIDSWENGRTKAAITCVWYVAKELEKRGIPVHRVIPSDSTIEAVLGSILLKQEGLRYRDTQIAVLKLIAETDNGLKELLKYSQQIQGSLITIAPQLYTLYTTRGAVKTLTDHFTAVPESWAVSVHLCGIGIGRTAYEAERLADEALARSKAIGRGSWIVCFDNKTVTGPLGKWDQLSFKYVSEKLHTLSRDTVLSASTLNKVDAILRKLGTDELNANELAEHMRMMPRSARRILLQLEQEGFAQIVGEESPHTRGRPLKTYRISLKRQG